MMQPRDCARGPAARAVPWREKVDDGRKTAEEKTATKRKKKDNDEETLKACMHQPPDLLLILHPSHFHSDAIAKCDR